MTPPPQVVILEWNAQERFDVDRAKRLEALAARLLVAVLDEWDLGRRRLHLPELHVFRDLPAHGYVFSKSKLERILF